MSSDISNFLSSPDLGAHTFNELKYLAELKFPHDTEKRERFFWNLKTSLIRALEDHVAVFAHHHKDKEVRETAVALLTCFGHWKISAMEITEGSSTIEPPTLLFLFKRIFQDNGAIIAEALKIAEEYTVGGPFTSEGRMKLNFDPRIFEQVQHFTQRRFRRANLNWFKKDDFERDTSVELDGYQLFKITRKYSALYETLGFVLQNCLRPRLKFQRLPYFVSNSVEYLLCDLQGKIHVMLSARNGVLEECRSKQNDYPSKYYSYIHQICKTKGWDYTQDHTNTGLLKFRSAVYEVTHLPDELGKKKLGMLAMHDAKSPVELPPLLNVGRFQAHNCPGLTRLPPIKARKSIDLTGCTHLKEWKGPVETPILILNFFPKVWPRRSRIGLIQYDKKKMSVRSFLKMRRKALNSAASP
jgi:hypothetical protein